MSDETKEVTSFDEVDVTDSNLLKEDEQPVEKPPEAPKKEEKDETNAKSDDEVKDPEPAEPVEPVESTEPTDPSEPVEPSESPKFTIKGKEYTEEELKTALTDSSNKSDWQKEFTEKAEDFRLTREMRRNVEPVIEFFNKIKGDTDLFLEIKEAMVEKHGDEIIPALDAAFKFDVDKYPNPYKTELEAKEQENVDLRSGIALDKEKLTLKESHKLKDVQVEEVVNFAIEKFKETGQALLLEDVYKLMDYETQVKKAAEKPKPNIPSTIPKNKGADNIKKADKLPEKFDDISVEDADLFKEDK